MLADIAVIVLGLLATTTVSSWTSASWDPGISFDPVIPNRPDLTIHGRPGVRMLLHAEAQNPNLTVMP